MKKIYVDFLIANTYVNVNVIMEENKDYTPVIKRNYSYDSFDGNNLNNIIVELKKELKKNKFHKSDCHITYNVLLNDDIETFRSIQTEKIFNNNNSYIDNKMKSLVNDYEKNFYINEKYFVVSLNSVLFTTYLNNEKKNYSKFPQDKKADKLVVKYFAFYTAKNGNCETIVKTFERNKIKINNIQLTTEALAKYKKEEKKKVFIDFANNKITIFGLYNNKVCYYNSLNADFNRKIVQIKEKYKLDNETLKLNINMVLQNWKMLKDSNVESNLQKSIYNEIDKLYSAIINSVALVLDRDLKSFNQIEIHSKMSEYYIDKFTAKSEKNFYIYDESTANGLNINKYSLALLAYENRENTSSMIRTLSGVEENNEKSPFKRFFEKIFNKKNTFKSE